MRFTISTRARSSRYEMARARDRAGGMPATAGAEAGDHRPWLERDRDRAREAPAPAPRAAGRYLVVVRSRRASRQRYLADRSEGRPRADRRRPGRRAHRRRRQAARLEPMAAVRHAGDAYQRALEAPRYSSQRRRQDHRCVDVRRGVLADHPVRAYRRDSTPHHRALRPRWRSLGPGVRAPLVRRRGRSLRRSSTGYR